MSEEEPQKQSIQARIAALKLSQVGRTPIAPTPIPNTAAASTTPSPPTDHRFHSTFSPTSPHGNGTGNEPRIGEKGLILPPPTITRTGERTPSKATGPPQLPPRKDSAPSHPSLPPRKPTTELARRSSRDSTSSSASGQFTQSNDVRRFSAATTTASQTRIKAPAYDPSILPPLPVKRTAQISPQPFVSSQESGRFSTTLAHLTEKVKSPRTPTLPQRQKSSEQPPSGPRRLPPPGVPSISSRPSPSTIESAPAVNGPRPNQLNGLANRVANRVSHQVSDQVSAQVNNEVARNVPNGVPKGISNGISNGINRGVSASVSHGINNGLAANGLDGRGISIGNPSTAELPRTTFLTPVELGPRTFDEVVLRSSRPALIAFTVPYCRYCKELSPVFESVAAAFSHCSDQVTIGKVDVQAHPIYLKQYSISMYPTLKWFDGNSVLPEDYMGARDLADMSRWVSERTGLQPSQLGKDVPSLVHRTVSTMPPPISMSSRPDLSRIMATKPKTTGSVPTPSNPSAETTCLKCRDFSEADMHAAKFPRQSVPSLDWLADQLTAPFSSLTDKARAIFTWLHHNIDYDTVAFFGNNVKPSTPASTLATGLAVCEGYAGLFSVLATKSGMGSIVISGHGKGFGFAAVSPGGPVPPESAGHAWNAVKLDDGNWKLVDPCWGAGNVKGKGQPYNREFSPTHFTRDNDEFGLSHFPTNRAQQFRLDGRIIEWNEYVLGDQRGPPVRVYSDIAPREGLSESRFLPATQTISLSHDGPTVRFQFEKVCPHWDPLKHAGASFCYVLALGKGSRGHGDFIPFETNTDQGGLFWWVDVPIDRLGAKGETISCFTVNTVNGASGRGLGKKEYLAAQGKKAMGFSGVAAWELVG